MTDPLNRAPTTALQKAQAGLPPLPGTDAPLQFVTLYVDSVTGSDVTGIGSQARPFASLARAWFERQQYLELRVVLTIQLIGAGPYDLPPMGASECAANGYFVIKGDEDAETTIVTGTATGDFAGQVLPTSALGGVNNCRDEFVRMTSGACAGAVFQVTANTANNLTVANLRARTINGAIVNGDTFEVVRPGTQIRITTSGTSNPTPHSIDGWKGLAPSLSFNVARHWFYDVRFVTTDASRLAVYGSEIGFSMVRFERGLLCEQSSVNFGLAPRSRIFGFGGSTANGLTFGAGAVCVSAGSLSVSFSNLSGVLSWGVFAIFLTSLLMWFGGRGAVGALFYYGSRMVGAGVGQQNSVEGTWEINFGSEVDIEATGVWVAAVTSGSVMRVLNFGMLTIGAAFTGGTTDAAGFGVDARGGGRVLYKAVTPQLTGGTLNQDLRTTNVTAQNSALNANNTAVGNAADALLGEVLARVA